MLQFPLDFPIKYWRLTIYGKEIEGSIIEDSNYIDETDYGEIEVNYQTAEFIVNGKKYLSHNEKNWLDLPKNTRVIIQYLPLNPKINRFREDDVDNPDSNFGKLFSLLLSIFLPCIMVYSISKR
ncbi:MAG: hypothetical protein R2774_03425 [Saprospiraceae bacterium]